MAYIFESLSHYVQSAGLISEVGKYLAPLGDHIAVIADERVLSIVRNSMGKSSRQYGVNLKFFRFRGECCEEEIERLNIEIRKARVQVIAGVGGGKTLDTAKLVSFTLNMPMVSIPTLASTDAPVSRVAVINTAEGRVQEIRLLPQHPRMVLVDSDVIIHAPKRFLVAGIGDALSTWFEARACSYANGVNLFRGHPTQAGLALARACWDNLTSCANEAVRAATQQTLSPSAEIVIETIILLSGLGFENGGLALAHALHNGLSQLPCTEGTLHGEKVAFGLLVQCVAEEANETEEVLALLQEVGLPTTLEALGCHSNKDSLKTVVNYVFSREITKIRNEPIEISPQQLINAILEANSLGREGDNKRGGDQSGTWRESGIGNRGQ